MLRYLGDPDKDLPSGQESEPQPDELTSVSEQNVEQSEWASAEDMPLSGDLSADGEDDPQLSMFKEKLKGLEHRISYLERIVKVSQMLNSTLSLEPLLQIIIQSATELTSTEACSIMLVDKNTGEL